MMDNTYSAPPKPLATDSNGEPIYEGSVVVTDDGVEFTVQGASKIRGASPSMAYPAHRVTLKVEEPAESFAYGGEDNIVWGS